VRTLVICHRHSSASSSHWNWKHYKLLSTRKLPNGTFTFHLVIVYYHKEGATTWGLRWHRFVFSAGGLVMAKSGRAELGDNIYGHYRSIFNHCDVVTNLLDQQSNRIRWKRKIRAIMLFKVIEVSTNRKPVCDFPLVLIELFLLGVTADALRANISSKSSISLLRGPVDPKFQVEGVAPHQPFFLSEN